MKTTVQRKRQFQKGAAPTIGCGNGSGTFDGSMELGQILYVMAAYKNGDFSVRLPTTWIGVLGKMADTMNDILTVSERRACETVRVCRVVGKEGRLKQRFSVPGMAGGWADEIESLNTLIDDLVWPTTEVTRAVGAVAKGDLGQSMALEVDGRALEGEFLRSAKLVNKMIEQLSVFTSEVTRVAREVGTEGKLGGQAQVKGVSGVWKELTDSVNQMAGNLTAQVRNIADVTIAVANGDLSKKITVDVRGEILQLKEAINTMVDQLRRSRRKSRAWRARSAPKASWAARRSCRRGGHVEGPDRQRQFHGVESDGQVRNIADVTTAVARGDLSRKITVDVSGEILELKETINTMVDQLSAFASEVTRVAREVGTEGQARRPGAGAGRGRHLEGSDRHVNPMAGQPHRPGAQHRRRHDGRRAAATCREKSRST